VGKKLYLSLRNILEERCSEINTIHIGIYMFIQVDTLKTLDIP
jgi:hypothetical protein